MASSTTVLKNRTGRVLAGAAAGWVAVCGVVLLLGRDGAAEALDRPALAGRSAAAQVGGATLALTEALLLIGLVLALTRGRRVPDLAAGVPDRRTAAREIGVLTGYLALALTGGAVLGRALGWHAFGFHLVGTVHGTSDTVGPAEVLAWAAYGLVAYAAVPYLWFHRRYGTAGLGLVSTDRRRDALLVLAVLVAESAVQLLAYPGITRLGPAQLAVGAPVSFAAYFAGAVLPTLVVVQCVLVPRLLRLTGSVPAAVALGGVAYALVHVTDAWTDWSSVRGGALSVALLLLQYAGPGAVKAALTLRTGNAWVHVWAYHAFAPHVLVDTPAMTGHLGGR